MSTESSESKDPSTSTPSTSSSPSSSSGSFLYWAPFSQPSRAVYQLLLEANVLSSYTIKEVNLLKRENKTPEYLAINPQGFVPALVDNGFQLAESSAILIYLCSKHGLEDVWYPSAPRVRALIDEFLYWYPSTVRDTFTGLTRASLVSKNQKLAQEKFEQIPKVMPHVERRLSKRQYIATDDHPTIADLQLYHELNGPVLSGFGGFNLDPYPHTKEWLHRMDKRPASKKAVGKFQTISKFAGGVIKFKGIFSKNKLTL